MQIVNTLYAIGLNPDGSINCFGHSPNTNDDGTPNPIIEFPDGLNILTFDNFNDYQSAFVSNALPVLLPYVLTQEGLTLKPVKNLKIL